VDIAPPRAKLFYTLHGSLHLKNFGNRRAI
jgi:hypothetical protein